MGYDPNTIRGAPAPSTSPMFAASVQAEQQAGAMRMAGVQSLIGSVDKLSSHHAGLRRDAQNRTAQRENLEREYQLRSGLQSQEWTYRTNIEREQQDRRAAENLLAQEMEAEAARELNEQQSFGRNQAMTMFQSVKPTTTSLAESHFGEVTDSELEARLRGVRRYAEQMSTPEGTAQVMKEMRRPQKKRILDPAMGAQMYDHLVRTGHEPADADRAMEHITEGSTGSLEEFQQGLNEQFLNRYGQALNKTQYRTDLTLAPHDQTIAAGSDPVQLSPDNIANLFDPAQVDLGTIRKYAQSDDQAQLYRSWMQRPDLFTSLMQSAGPIMVNPDGQGGFEVVSERQPWLGQLLTEVVETDPSTKQRMLGRMGDVHSTKSPSVWDKGGLGKQRGMMDELSDGAVDRARADRIPLVQAPPKPTPVGPPEASGFIVPKRPKAAPKDKAKTTDNTGDYDISDDLREYLEQP